MFIKFGGGILFSLVQHITNDKVLLFRYTVILYMEPKINQL